MKKEEKKEAKPFKNKRKIAAASMGLLVAAALVVGTMIPSASDVVSPAGIIDPPAIVLQLDDAQMTEEEQTAPENRKAARLSERIKGWILGLPQGLRVMLVLPLWGLGTFLSAAASVLWTGLFSPALGVAVSWLLGAAVLLGTFGLGAKLLFPNLPLKKIFHKRNLIALGGMALLLVAADGILPLYWPEYTAISAAVKAVLSLGLVALLLLRLKKKNSFIFS